MGSLFNDDLDNLPFMSISGETGIASISMRIIDADGEIRYLRQPLERLEFALDTRTLMRGGVRFKPQRDFSQLRPLGQPQIPCPPGYQNAWNARVFVIGHGMHELTTTSFWVSQALETAIRNFMGMPEAELGLIPLYLLAGSKARFSVAYGKTNQQPLLQLQSGVKRDGRFGPPTVPLPAELRRIQEATARTDRALEFVPLASRTVAPATLTTAPPAPVTMATASGPVTLEADRSAIPVQTAVEDDEIAF